MESVDSSEMDIMPKVVKHGIHKAMDMDTIDIDNA